MLYHQALGTAVRAPNPRKHMAATYTVANVLVYAVWAALEIAIACTHGTVRVDVHMAEVVFAVTVNIASAVIFWVYGTCVYNKYRVLANSFVHPRPLLHMVHTHIITSAVLATGRRRQ